MACGLRVERVEADAVVNEWLGEGLESATSTPLSKVRRRGSSMEPREYAVMRDVLATVKRLRSRGASPDEIHEELGGGAS
jgi:hypothetical protein